MSSVNIDVGRKYVIINGGDEQFPVENVFSYDDRKETVYPTVLYLRNWNIVCAYDTAYINNNSGRTLTIYDKNGVETKLKTSTSLTIRKGCHSKK